MSVGTSHRERRDLARDGTRARARSETTIDADGGTVSPALLRYQLLRRGKLWRDLLKQHGGPFSADTVTRLRTFRSISSPTALVLAQYLRKHQVIPELDSVLVAPPADAVMPGEVDDELSNTA